MAVARVGGRTVFVYAERPQGEPRTRLAWADLELDPLRFGAFRRVAYSSPEPTGPDGRPVSALTVDSAGHLYVASASDPGSDDGPYTSYVWLAGRFRATAEGARLIVDRAAAARGVGRVQGRERGGRRARRPRHRARGDGRRELRRDAPAAAGTLKKRATAARAPPRENASGRRLHAPRYHRWLAGGDADRARRDVTGPGRRGVDGRADALDHERGADAMSARERFAAELERYRELFDFAPVGYCVTTADGVVHEANETLGRMLGVDASALAGRPLATYVVGRERRAFAQRLARAVGDTGEHTWEAQMCAGRGRRFHGELTVARARTPAHHGELLWAVRDVTERRDAEEDVRRLARELEQRVAERTSELERERARVETVIRQLPAGIAIAEAPSGRIVLANRLARPFIGRDAVKGPTAAVWRDGRPLEPDELPLARALAGETVTAARMHVPDTGVVVEASAGPVVTRGRIVAAVAIFVDVTERERAHRAVREFVANAAHELQTPLAAIVSASDVLQSGAKEVPEERDRFLAHIERQSVRLTRLVRALLVLARAQSGAEQARVEVIPLEGLLEEIVADVAASASVPVEVECEPGVAVVANADLARQAVLNVAANAAYHTERGRIVISARAHDDERVVVEVRDTGRGVPRERQERVFERFHRGADRGESGFGLGLPIVREAASALGGDVVLESEPGIGTTVRLTLPGARLVES